MHKRERARERERQITPMGKHTRLTFDAPMYMYMCVHIYKHICTCIHTYIHVYIYTHTYIYTYTWTNTHTDCDGRCTYRHTGRVHLRYMMFGSMKSTSC